MRGINSECIDLIYLDPPFNSKRNYAAPIGSKAAGAEFKDTWTLADIDEEWITLIKDKYPRLYRILLAAYNDSDKSYLVYMAVRLLEMHRLLKPTGSLYLHCDPTMSHSLKMVLDAIFGKPNFRNEIIWQYRTGGIGKKHWPRKHDSILFYAKTKKTQLKVEREESKDLKRFNRLDEDGRQYYEKAGNRYYADEGVAVTDVWDIYPVRNVSKERTGYPTQKPLELLRRIIKASSQPGDMVLDPFCGCATTCVAAEAEQRKWAGIDVSEKAFELVKKRIDRELGQMITHIDQRMDIPRRTDMGKLLPYRSKINKDQLYGMQHGHCAGCEKHFEYIHLEIDHIIAKKKGGTDHIENLQLLCGHCNRVKGDRGMEYLTVYLDLDKSKFG